MKNHIRFPHWYFAKIIACPIWLQLGLCVLVCLGLIAVLHVSMGHSINRAAERQQMILHQLESDRTSKTYQLAASKSDFSRLKPISLADLLTQLSQLAEANQLELESIKPSPAFEQQKVWVQPIVLSTYGSYRQLLNFCQQLQKLSVVTAITELHLESTSAEATEADLALRLTLAVFSTTV